MKAQTPLEKLTADKQRIKLAAYMKEKELNANFQYIQEHGGKLLLSGAVSAILPGSKSTNKTRQSSSSMMSSSLMSSIPSALTGLALGGAKNYFSVGKNLLPVVWGIAQPFILTAGIKGAKKLIKNIFTRKKK